MSCSKATMLVYLSTMPEGVGTCLREVQKSTLRRSETRDNLSTLHFGIKSMGKKGSRLRKSSTRPQVLVVKPASAAWVSRCSPRRAQH